jgi:glyoxylase-like metal-dependent hydrolase (beta-lactamase superfamily II)
VPVRPPIHTLAGQRPAVALALFLAALAGAALGIHAQARATADPIRTGDIAARGLTARDFPRITKLADRVFAYEQVDPTKRIVTVNNLIVTGSRGVLVADGQGTAANTERLVADIRTITPQPIAYVVIASEHGDHTGGNAAFPSSAVFLASPASKANLEQQAARARGRANAAPAVVPSEAVADRRVVSLGDIDVEVLSLGRAHTGGDLAVYVPSERILWMSEIFSNRIFPSMANSAPSEWLRTLDRAEAMDVRVFVPAHGFVDPPAVLNEEERNFHRALERVIAEGKRLHDAGVPVDQAAAQADFGEFADWTRRDANAASALRRVYMELDGELR